MRPMSANILKALHEGYVLRKVYEDGEQDPSHCIAMTWQIEGSDDETHIETPERSRAYPRNFPVSAFWELHSVGLTEGVPNTGEGEVVALTPYGLYRAQELYGPISAKVMVKHEDGIESLSPEKDGSDAYPTGEIIIRDDMEPAAPGGP